MFRIVYDQPIYTKNVANPTAALRTLSDAAYQNVTATCAGNQKFAAISRQLVNMISINCVTSAGSAFSIPSLQSQDLCSPFTGSPIFGQPIADAAGSFVNLYKGGATITENVRNNTFTVIVPLVNSELKSFFSQSQGRCNIGWKTGAPLILVNNEQIVLIG